MGEDDQSGTQLNRALRRHLFKAWHNKTPKLEDQDWLRKVRANRKRIRHYKAQERRLNAQAR